MTNLSIIFLNRSGHDKMDEALASLPPGHLAEVIYVTPAPVSKLVVAPASPDALRVEYPMGLPDDIDRVLAAKLASGVRLLYTDTHTLFKPWEISNIATMLTESLGIALRLHRPPAKEREVENIADLAAMALNQMLGREALAASSLLRFPHGLYRDVVQTIGPDELRVPPRFFAHCVLAGVGVDAFYREEEPLESVGSDDRVIQSHLSAILEVLRDRGPRGGFTDFDRRRDPLDSLLKAMHVQ